MHIKIGALNYAIYYLCSVLCEKPYAMTTEVQPQYNNRSAAVASTVKPEIILYD